MSYCFQESEETTLLRESVRNFAREKIKPQAQKLDKAEEFSYELTEQMGELGLFGAVIDPKYQGHGLDYHSYIVCVEELARIDGSQAATVAAHNSLGAAPIAYYGTEAQKEKYLPSLCDGKGLWAFGLTEPEAGSDAQASKTTARYNEQDDTWTLNGSKIWITNSATDITKGVTIQAVTGKRDNGRPELSCFLVPKETPGLTCRKMTDKMMWRASNTGEVYLDNVVVPNEALLGKRGEGFAIMMETLNNGRLSIGAMGLGHAKGALDLATEYAKERKTFGKSLIEHQSIAFKLSDMALRIEAGENMLYKAVWQKQNKLDFRKLSSMAKLYCSEAAEFCAREGQQIFGGYGLMKEYDIERHYRDAALLRIGEGTSEIQRLIISRML